MTHLLLDVPSFASDGSLRGGGSLPTILERLPPGITLIGGSLAFVFLRALAKNGQLARFQTALGSEAYAASSDVWTNAVGIAALGLIGYLASVVLLKMLLKLSGTWVTVVPYALVGVALLAAVCYLIRNRSQLRQKA